MAITSRRAQFRNRGPRPRSGFYPAPGTDYTAGQEPELARRLNRLAKALKLHLTGISGYRTPSHSEAVGGFADDPHTRGQASDTPGIEGVPERTLERFGLTRPFQGSAEADHIQLFGGAKGSKARNPLRTSGNASLGALWVQAGGARNLAPLMAAIAMAESSGKTDAIGGPNADGSYDYGPWQINSSHTQFNRAKLLSDPLYNARAAVSIERSQGLGAWSTYTSGAYKPFLGSASGALPTFGRTRPGGDPKTILGGIDEQYTGYMQESIDLGKDKRGFFGEVGHDAGGVFSAVAGAITSPLEFLKWIAWIFHPRNILRVVEFTVGFTIMGLGLLTMTKVYQDAAADTGGAVRRGAGELFQRTPIGRATRIARGKRTGRQSARGRERSRQEQSAARSAETRQTERQGERNLKRQARREKRSGEEIPF